ncbi:unnamed protein product [Ectocarpus sp. 13 AM-2016]
MATDGVVKWIFSEFIPFGDIVSDLALIATLPSTDDADGGSSYHFMSWALWLGTFISTIPEMAIIVGVLTGIAVGAILGPATHSAHGEGREVLLSTYDQTITLVRYVFSDSKVITRFLLYFIEDVPPGWNNAVALAARFVFVTLFPVAYPLVKLWTWVSGNNDDAGRPWYSVLILLQVVGGLMTEVSSIYFAVSTKNGLSVASALFGMYSLVVSTLISRLKGPKNADEEESFAQRSQKLAATSGQQIMKYGPVGFAVVVGLGFLIMPFLGVYLILECKGSNMYHPQFDDCEDTSQDGEILASIGFVVLALFWLFSFYCAYSHDDGVITPEFAMVFFSGLGILVLGLGIVYGCYEGEDSPGYVIAIVFFGCLISFVVVPAIWYQFFGKYKRADDDRHDRAADRGSTSVVRGSRPAFDPSRAQ